MILANIDRKDLYDIADWNRRVQRYSNAKLFFRPREGVDSNVLFFLLDRLPALLFLCFADPDVQSGKLSYQNHSSHNHYPNGSKNTVPWRFDIGSQIHWFVLYYQIDYPSKCTVPAPRVVSRMTSDCNLPAFQ